MRSEKLAQFDRDKNDILDLMKMQSDHKDYFKELSFPFNIKLYSKEQLYVLEQISKESDTTFIHFDATGTVVRHPYKEKKRILLYTAVVSINKQKRVFPIFSMLSSKHDSNTIFKILHDFRYFCEENNKWPLFTGIVTDFSFANIHAIVKAFNRLTLREYLRICMKIVLHQEEPEPNWITVHLCCAHFMKMVSKDMNDLCTNERQRLIFKDILAAAINFKKIEKFDSWFIHLSIVLKTKTYDKKVNNSLKLLLDICDIKGYKDTKDNREEEVMQTETTKLSHKTVLHNNGRLYASSPFFQRYSELLIDTSHEGNVTNVYYNEEILNLILKKYIPYSPLWSGLMMNNTRNIDRLSNAMIENYFGNLKKYVLDGQKNFKCSRFIRQHMQDVASIYKEVSLNISKTQLTQRSKNAVVLNNVDPSDEKLSQESWNKRNKGNKTHFSGQYLKQLKTQLLDEKQNGDIDRKTNDIIILDDTTRCAYCGYGKFFDTTTFVQCDRCDQWVHKTCEANEDDSFSGDFICRLCNFESDSNKTIPDVTLVTKCNEAINNLVLSESERLELQILTALQSKCERWREERRKRVTASFFARICKSRDGSKKI